MTSSAQHFGRYRVPFVLNCRILKHDYDGTLSINLVMPLVRIYYIWNSVCPFCSSFQLSGIFYRISYLQLRLGMFAAWSWEWVFCLSSKLFIFIWFCCLSNMWRTGGRGWRWCRRIVEKIEARDALFMQPIDSILEACMVLGNRFFSFLQSSVKFNWCLDSIKLSKLNLSCWWYCNNKTHWGFW